jgi:hypothetical protein
MRNDGQVALPADREINSVERRIHTGPTILGPGMIDVPPKEIEGVPSARLPAGEECEHERKRLRPRDRLDVAKGRYLF